jgi:predicted glycosyltransferase
MKIWIDFINTPQVSFWIPFIREFEKENHQLILTCRDSGNTVALLRLNGLKFHVIGEGAGKGRRQKMLLFPKRLFKLYAFMRKNRPDMAASQSSFYQPIVSRVLGIPCLYTNDNEHAKGNLFGFWFASKVILPVAFQHETFVKKRMLKSKVSFYPSVKEAIYLSQQSSLLSMNGTVRDVVYFRPEPWSAQYYKGPLNFFDDILLQLASEYKVVVLPRDKNQADHYNQQKFEKLTVAEKPLTLKEIVNTCKLFIGAGGSMTRELAVLGIPVISIYQEEMLMVDNYLVERGCLVINPTISYEEIKAKMEDKTSIKNDSSVLNEGIESYRTIKNLIVNLKQ